MHDSLTVDQNQIIRAVSIICRQNEQFLLVKRGKEPLKGWLAFPGGSVEAHESALDAAHRELFEETALQAQHMELLDTIDLSIEASSSYHKPYFLAIFRAKTLTGTPCAGDDAVSLHWLQAHEMEAAGATPSSCRVAAHLAIEEAL